MLYEKFRRQVIAEHAPAAGSPLMLALLEADELAARRDAAQPAYTAAAERVRALYAEVFKPVWVDGLSGAALIDHERRGREYREAQEAETTAAAELNRLTLALRAKQEKIVAMISFPAVDDAARQRALDALTGRAS